MGFEWQMVDEDLRDGSAIDAWLQLGYEPFAVARKSHDQDYLHVFFKKPVVTERDLKSTEVAGSLRGDSDATE